MSLIQEIDNIRKKIYKLSKDIAACGSTRADRILAQELYLERKELYLQLGRLCANSGLLICLR